MIVVEPVEGLRKKRETAEIAGLQGQVQLDAVVGPGMTPGHAGIDLCADAKTGNLQCLNAGP